MMIYIHSPFDCLECSLCADCPCECTTLDVFLNEGTSFNYKNKTKLANLSKETKWLEEYQKTRLLLREKIKKQYPNALNITIYPFVKELLPYFNDSIYNIKTK